MLAVIAPLILMWPSSAVYGQTQSQHSTADLDLLLQQKRYVELEQALATSASDMPFLSLTYFEGVMANRTNQVRRSIHFLEPVLPALFAGNPLRGEVALCTLADDYAKSFRYADAAKIYAEANRAAKQQGKDSECDADRETSRWTLLSGAPPQTVTGARAFTVPGKRDAFGLFEVEVTAGNYVGSWIVDSGANLSVITRSVADKMGLELSTEEETAQGIGLSVPVHTAVIPELRLGKAVLRNVAVVVAEESDMSFPNVGYQIEGCLGLPVLAALGRITFYPDGRVNFSKVQTDEQVGPNSLFLEKFTPLIAADFGHGNQLFTFDTGAGGTVLSAKFYREAREYFDPANLVNLELIGVGGTLVSPAYILGDAVARLGEECTKVGDIQVLTEPTGAPDEFYGNVGQSAVSSFSSFTLDFKAMQFSVSGGNAGNCAAH